MFFLIMKLLTIYSDDREKKMLPNTLQVKMTVCIRQLKKLKTQELLKKRYFAGRPFTYSVGANTTEDLRI